jgi:hypothetical protein
MNVIAVAAGAVVVAALAIGINAKLGQDEAEIARIVQTLEKDPDGVQTVAVFLHFQDECHWTHSTRPYQLAFERYARAHPQVASETLKSLSGLTRGLEADFVRDNRAWTGFRRAMEGVCPLIKMKLRQQEAKQIPLKYGHFRRHTPEVGAVCGKAARTVLVQRG